MRSLAGFRAILACLLTTSAVVLGTDATAVVFDDGMVHVIDAGNSFPFEAAVIRDGPGGVPTTVFLVVGGKQSGVFDSSQLVISGGEVDASVDAWDDSVVEMSVGVLQGDLRSSGASSVIMSGGSVSSASAHGFNPFTFSGGEIRVNATSTNNGVFNFLGGTAALVQARVTSEMNVFGGSPAGPFISMEDATLNVFGSDFNLPSGDVALLAGTLTGTLADGTPLNVDFGRASSEAGASVRQSIERRGARRAWDRG